MGLEYLENTLKVLGFREEQIDYAIKNIDKNLDFETMVEESIMMISENIKNIR